MRKLILVFLILYTGEIHSQNILVFPDKPTTVRPVVSKTTRKNLAHTPLREREGAGNNTFYFFDSFMNNRNNWTIANDSSKTMSIIPGWFRIQGKNNEGFECLKNFDIDVNKDFYCSALMDWGGGVKNGFGIKFCCNPSKQSYNGFSISSAGYYLIYNRENGGNWKTIKEWTASIFVNQGVMRNKLAVKKEGNYISYYINDHVVERYPFYGTYGHSFGFSSNGQQNIDFDDFLLTGTKK